ncbi:MAG TPA: vitamin B12 dependent-methionine synthase activation domain-containing protein [Clostridia bacterium]|nr:vitamin B12 dependent-methionine synthase activation domain-containing protein [Clostridia bacterium]
MDEIAGDRVVIEGVSFHSAVLARNLAKIHRVFAYVATCGREVDDWSHREPDVFISLWLDMIKEMILRDAQSQFRARLCERYALTKISGMSPGSGNMDVWPIAQQAPLFALIGGVTEDTGVQLKESFLMIPTKSVSGVLFPTEVPFYSCMLCSRPHCIGRRAPYDPASFPNTHP